MQYIYICWPIDHRSITPWSLWIISIFNFYNYPIKHNSKKCCPHCIDLQTEAKKRSETYPKSPTTDHWHGWSWSQPSWQLILEESLFCRWPQYHTICHCLFYSGSEEFPETKCLQGTFCHLCIVSCCHMRVCVCVCLREHGSSQWSRTGSLNQTPK